MSHLIKKKPKGFTLIELLVVVAIIGILAAVGVVAYSGYTSGAKKSTIKQNYKTIYKKFRAERAMCSIDSSSSIYDGTLKCSVDNTGTIIPALENYYDHSKGKTPLKNIIKSKDINFFQHRGCDEFTKDEAYGHMYICVKSHSPGLVEWKFSACFEQPCSNANNRVSNEFIGAPNYD